jgi:hypothetical protein
MLVCALCTITMIKKTIDCDNDRRDLSGRYGSRTGVAAVKERKSVLQEITSRCESSSGPRCSPSKHVVVGMLGRYFADTDPESDDPDVVWDAYYLYGPDAQWSGRDQCQRATAASDTGSGCLANGLKRNQGDFAGSY